MFGIIGAMKIETDNIIAMMTGCKTEEISGILFTKGTISAKEVVVATCGIGKVFAALCAETMILHYHPDVIVNIGVAGSLCPELHVCSLVVADQVCQHDMDTSALGDPVGLISGVNRVYFPCDEQLSAAFLKIANKLKINALSGTVASGDQFISDSKEKAAIRDSFSAVACEMEGGAIGQVCYVNHIPFCILRSISDGAQGDSAMDYAEFSQIAAQQAQRLISAFLD